MLDRENVPEINRVGPEGKFPKVRLMEPTTHGYVLLVAEVDHRPPVAFFIESAGKKALLETLKAACAELEGAEGVLDATCFKALVIPPGRGRYLDRRPDVTLRKFDVAVLIECDMPERARALRESEAVRAMEAAMRGAAKAVEVITASNVKRIGPVDHSRDGVFLFNYFVADTLGQNLGVWQYTAGWFQDQTGLDNSTVLLPDAGAETDATIINHCRWDHLSDIVPSLLFKPSFRNYVLANFEANATAAVPVLYRLA